MKLKNLGKPIPSSWILKIFLFQLQACPKYNILIPRFILIDFRAWVSIKIETRRANIVVSCPNKNHREIENCTILCILQGQSNISSHKKCQM